MWWTGNNIKSKIGNSRWEETVSCSFEWVHKNNYDEVNLGKEITDDGLAIDDFNFFFVF